jgi:hypothetical protein
VLLYVLWIMAAVTLTLAAFSVRTSGGAAVPEQALSHALETRQMVTVLDYVLRHAAEFNPTLDPRLLAYEQILAQQAAQSAGADDRLAVLREILTAMNFKMDIADPRLAEKKAEAKGGAGGAGPSDKDRDKDKDKPLGRVKYAPRAAPYALRIGEDDFTVTVEFGNSRPNLNSLEQEPLERYLAHLGVPPARAQALAATIRDWTDEDDFTRDGGAESNHYRALALPYDARNDRIQTTGELGYVKGMTPGVLRLLRENFGLHSRDSRVLSGVLSEAAFGALADLPPARVKIALQLATGTVEVKPETPLLLREEEEKIARVLSLRGDTHFVRVRVQGKHSRVTAWYDTQARRILDWWFD